MSGDLEAVRAQICGEIRSIMRLYREQDGDGTPGGLEHMGDVWRLLGKWDAALSRLEAQQPKHAGWCETATTGRCTCSVGHPDMRGEQPTPPECPNVARLFQLISGGIGLMNNSEAQKTVLRWWNAVRPELEKSVAPCSPCPMCAAKDESINALCAYLGCQPDEVERLFDALTRKVEKLLDALRLAVDMIDKNYPVAPAVDECRALLVEREKEQGWAAGPPKL